MEYDERIYNKAIENKEKAISAGRVAFKAENAEYFSVPREVDRIYFFNPFSLEILQKVIHRILESYYEKPREIKLLFYYPSDEYISYLMTVDEFMFEDEIDCRDLFPEIIWESGLWYLDYKYFNQEMILLIYYIW